MRVHREITLPMNKIINNNNNPFLNRKTVYCSQLGCWEYGGGCPDTDMATHQQINSLTVERRQGKPREATFKFCIYGVAHGP